jgi:integrase
MASCFIVSRSTKSGRKHVVRYRLGGRTYPIRHGGAFPTQKEAKVRRDLIAGELAAGRNPAELLATITTPPTIRTFSDVFDSFVASRVDVSEATLENYRTHRARLVKQLGTKAPEAIRWQEVQDAIGSLAEELAASSLRGYLGTLRLVLDYADVDPNPARDRRVKLPRVESEIPTPPTASEVAAIIANAPKKWRLAIRVLEQTGMRVGELGGIGGATSTMRTCGCASAPARRSPPAASSSCPNGSWKRSKRHAHRTTAPRLDVSSPARAGRPSGTRSATAAAPPDSSATPRTTYGTATSR